MTQPMHWVQQSSNFILSKKNKIHFTLTEFQTMSANASSTTVNAPTGTVAINLSVATTTAVTAAQSNSIYDIIQNTGVVSVTLPALASGLYYKFIVSVASIANAVTITAPSACIVGTVLSSDGTAVTGGAVTTAKTNVVIGTTAGIGDSYEFTCDGTHYFLKGFTSVHGSVTFS